MSILRKKLSKKLFHQYLEQHDNVYTDNIVIDCSNLDSKIKDHDVFAFCREVFSKPFHFDHDGIAFELKEYMCIVNTYEKDILYGTCMLKEDDIMDIYEGFLYIDINTLMSNNNEIKEVLDTDLKFDPKKI